LEIRNTFDSVRSLEDVEVLSKLVMPLAPMGAGETPSYWHSLEIKGSGTEWVELQRGVMQLFDVGILEYDDVFGKHHTVTWCYYYVLTTQLFFPYERFNTAD
jgi:hypothetical protein